MAQIIITEDGKVNDDKLSLLLRKGVYPYSYMDSPEKLKEGKPSIECFKNDLAKDDDGACHPEGSFGASTFVRVQSSICQAK